MTEVSHAWLDRIVTARQRAQDANRQISTLAMLVQRNDHDMSTYDDRAEGLLLRDGTGWRLHALRNRVATIECELREAECHGTSVGPVLLALTEVIDALNETVLNTEAILADDEPDEDPFIDRLEEHPAYERN